MTVFWGAILRGEFQPGSERNPLEMKVAITIRGEGFCSGWKAEKPRVIAAKFQPGLKREFEQAH